MSTNLTPQERFWKYVDKSNECWIWIGSRDKDGYGTFKIDYIQYRSHVVAYKWERGEIPEGLFVLHECDNPPCVRPSHLVVGTQSKNISDAYKRGRKIPAAGMRNGHARLTDEQIAEIRELCKVGIKQKAIAERYGIDPSYVSHLKYFDNRRN